MLRFQSVTVAGNVEHLTMLIAGVVNLLVLGSHGNSGKKYEGEAQSPGALNLPWNDMLMPLLEWNQMANLA